MRESMYAGMVADDDTFPIPMPAGLMSCLSLDAFGAFVKLSWLQYYYLEDGFEDDRCQTILRWPENWGQIKRELINFAGFKEANGRLSNPEIASLVQEQKQSKPPTPRSRTMGHKWRTIRQEVLIRDNFTCRYCGEKYDKMHVDHVIPCSRGGTNDVSNLVTACPSCNLSKNAKLEGEWLR